jgi:hypothetical protein
VDDEEEETNLVLQCQASRKWSHTLLGHMGPFQPISQNLNLNISNSFEIISSLELLEFALVFILFFLIFEKLKIVNNKFIQFLNSV